MQPDRMYPSFPTRFGSAIFIIWIVLIPSPVCGSDLDREINHLLHYIETSGCVFVRNNKEYNATEARDHIENKYEYVKRWVKTTEDFIEYAATKSSITGKPYLIRCDGCNQPSAKWLQTELERRRKP